jgi:endoglucanase
MPGNDYQLEFWVMGNLPGVKFDVRFIDTKTGDTDHPWRMGKTIDNSFAAWDGVWHKVTIPLSQLEEKGSWDNGWFNPEGKFNWKAIDRFEIVAEHQSLIGGNFHFDDVKITGEEIPLVTGLTETLDYYNLNLYPNPVIDNLNIEFQLADQKYISLSVYNLMGQKIKTITEGSLQAGHHVLRWDKSDDQGLMVSEGLYLVHLKTSQGSHIEKLVVGR